MNGTLRLLTVSGIAMLFATQMATAAQPPGGQPVRSPKAAAPVDFTGQWVSVVSEDWRWRMTTPLKRDYSSIPVNDAAKKLADQWDPATDEAAQELCKAYGVPTIMRMPGRLRVSWQGENVLKIETDAGQQTRLLQFGAAAPAAGEAPSLQGTSAARWEDPPGNRFRGNAGGGGGGTARAGTQSNTLQVVTTNIKPGYLRKNGLPFSPQAKVTEFFDMYEDPDGTKWFVVTTVVDDPTYLTMPWLTTTGFKQEKASDASKWRPTPCSVR